MPMSPRLLRPRENFTPRSIPGLQLWLDASDATTITLNGSNVSEWRDKSGKGNHFTQATASQQPPFVSLSRNGRSAINLPNSLAMFGPTGFSFAQPTTWFCAFQSPTSSGTWSLFDGDTSRQHIFGNAATEFRMFAGSSGAIASISLSTWYAAVLIYNGASSSHRLSAFAATTVNSGTNAITRPRIGATNGLRGDLGEIGVISRAVSDAEAASLLRHLSRRWAVTIS